jgi:diguanylate cyclase (GGDEF)-like protein
LEHAVQGVAGLAAAVQRLTSATSPEEVHAVLLDAEDLEVPLRQVLAEVATLALDNQRMRSQLEAVADRTAVVSEFNKQLEQEIEEHWRFAAEVYRQSVTDELTGLYNRRGFVKRAEQQLAILRESERPGLCLFLDLDGLKEINDAEGHEAGDQLLVEAAAVLQRLFRADDVIARIGGDEFAVFVAGYADVERVLARLREQEGNVRFSVGTAVFDPALPQSLYELLGAADADMYDDKRARRTG